jgi:hypothetical protein
VAVAPFAILLGWCVVGLAVAYRVMARRT